MSGNFFLGSILLALTCPSWYRKLLLGQFINKKDWGSDPFIQALPQKISAIILKTRFIGGSYFHLKEFLNELIQLKGNYT